MHLRPRLLPFTLVALLFTVSAPLAAQGQVSVTKQTVLGAVTLSASLLACGYKDEGLMAGQAAAKLLPSVGLHGKSDEVAEAFEKGGNAIINREVLCADVADYATRAGVTK